MKKNNGTISVSTQPKKPNELLNGFSYINSEERERQFPETWQRPSAAVINAVRPGDSIKVGVERPGMHGERFWVTVVEVSPSELVVSVDNDLWFASEHGLQYGDRLVVNRHHIIDVWRDITGRSGAVPSTGMAESDLWTLTHIVNQERGEADFRDRLLNGGRQFFYQELQLIPDDAESSEEREERLQAFVSFVNELVTITPPKQKTGPKAFERWLKEAVLTHLRNGGCDQEEYRRLLLETEWWGLVPSESEEQRAGITPTRSELAVGMSDFAQVPMKDREHVESGTDDVRPFQPKGTALTRDERWLLRRLAIPVERWDGIYGDIVERLAEDFCSRFYPVLRWIALDPDDVALHWGERLNAELFPGFRALFATLLKDALTVAVNQVDRYLNGLTPGTGPGMREFARKIMKP